MNRTARPRRSPETLTRRSASRAAAMLVLSLFLLSCATSPPASEFARLLALSPDHGVMVDGIPSLPYEARRSGPSSLAPLLAYWQRPALGTGDVAAAVAAEPLAPPEEVMAMLAERRNLWAFSFYGTLSELELRLRAGVPLLVAVQDNPVNTRTRRYMVVGGINRRAGQVLVQEGAREATVYEINAFTRLWRPTRNWTMVACPPEKADWNLRATECVALAQYFERRRQWYAALEFYRQAEQLAPHNQDLALAKAGALFRFGNKAEAMNLYRSLLLRNNLNARAANNLAFAMGDTGGPYDEAERLARRALTIEPGNAGYLDTLGFVLLKAGKPREAADVLARARHRADYLPMEHRRAILGRLIQSYLESDQPHLARQVYLDHLAGDPGFVLAEDLRRRLP